MISILAKNYSTLTLPMNISLISWIFLCVVMQSSFVRSVIVIFLCD